MLVQVELELAGEEKRQGQARETIEKTNCGAV
jgi:hypothetical protein